MKVWLATSQATGYVTVYDSYETLSNDLENLHEHELTQHVEECTEWRSIRKVTAIIDAWTQPNFENTPPSGWWQWESSILWRKYEYPYEDVVTSIRVDVKIVLEDWDSAQ